MAPTRHTFLLLASLSMVVLCRAVSSGCEPEMSEGCWRLAAVGKAIKYVTRLPPGTRYY